MLRNILLCGIINLCQLLLCKTNTLIRESHIYFRYAVFDSIPGKERYERKSVIIASQLPINNWYDYIGDPTLADAIMDRLISNANKIELKGEFMRQKEK